MWQFLVALLLALLYPGSLLLPAVFGLVFAMLPALLGTVLGDFVDQNHRMRGQNSIFGRVLNLCARKTLFSHRNVAVENHVHVNLKKKLTFCGKYEGECNF